MKLSVLSGAALLSNGFFVLGRPLRTRQVIGGWNPISDWTGILPKVPTLSNIFDDYQTANANLGAYPTFPASPASPGAQTIEIGGTDTIPRVGFSSDAYSFSPPPEIEFGVATNQLVGETPVTTDTLPITITEPSNKLPDTPVISSSGANFDEFDNPVNRYCFYPWSSTAQSVVLSANSFDDTPEGTQGCGHAQSWEQFSKGFVREKPGYVIYRDANDNYFSMTNLVNSGCQKTNGAWNCIGSESKSLISAEQSWQTIVRRKFASFRWLGQIHSGTEVQGLKGVLSSIITEKRKLKGVLSSTI